MTNIKAVLFDLHWTLVYVEKDITDEEVSEYLFSKDYEVSPQQWKAAWSFLSFIDYPEFGYKTWRSYLLRILGRAQTFQEAKKTLMTFPGECESSVNRDLVGGCKALNLSLFLLGRLLGM